METENKEEISIQQQNADTRIVAGFQTMSGFELLQRQAKMLSQCSMLPEQFRGNIPDCAIALEMSARMGYSVSPLLILQSIVPIHGKPTFEAKFVIGLMKSRCGFKVFDYEMSGEVGDAGEVSRTPKLGRDGKPLTDKKGYTIYDNKVIREGRTCLAYAIDKDGRRINGVPISMAMAKIEGWYDKSGSKWQTMPELMLRYRAATFFKNIHCPEITMGFRTSDEVLDIDADVEIVEDKPKKQKLFAKTEKPKDAPKPETEQPKEEPAPEPTPEPDAPTPPKEGSGTSADALEELGERLAEAGLTQEQCLAYAKKNGLTSRGKIDEFAARKILRAWETVKEFIAKEGDGNDDEF